MTKKEAPTTLYVVSEKYGEIDSKLSTGFTENVEKAEKKYKIENIPSEVIDICKEIQGVAGRALLVGGSVRDCVISREHPEMKLKPKDFDIEVYGLTIENLQRVLETKFGPDNVDSVGRSFGIIKVRIAGWDEPLDFSIPRTDSKSGEGHKGFDVEWKPELNMKAAAARRDITVNTMAYDPLTETIYDPYDGIKDIENKVLRITDEKAFREDPLRVIRIMQFAARFEFTVDPATEEICKQMVAEGELVIRKVDRSGDSFVLGESEKDGEEKTGFMVASGSQEIYLKPKTRNEKGLARERITEEIYKLLLKGKKPSLGFEFARRIGLMEALWPDMAAMHGVQQEEEWHKEKDVWTHAMESADVMVEIADREIAEGKLPPPDMLEELDERMKLYREQKKKIFLFNQLKQEIVEKMGQSTLDLLIAKAKKLGEDAGDKFMNRVKAEAKEDAFNIERNKFKSANNDWENDPDFETKVFEMGSRHFYDEEKKRIDQWSHEMKSISLGVEDKEIRRLIDEEIGKMAADGVLSTERLAEMENFAGILADGATEIERNKQLKIMKDELKIVLVLTSTCHDLGKVTTTKFEDGRIRSKRHEQEGVEPMRRVLSVFDTTRFSPRMRAMMLPLIAEHLKPGMIYRDNFDIKSDQDEKLEDESVDTEHIDEVGSIEIKKAKKVKRIMIRLAKRIAEGDGNRGGEKKSIYPDGGGANLYLLGLIAEADTRARKEGGVPSTREEMGKELDWQKWWNDTIEELNLNKPEPKVISGGEVMEKLRVKKGGPWVKVILNCVHYEVKEEMLKKNKEDALQAATDHYNRILIWVNSQYEMLSDEKRRKTNKDIIWKYLLSGDPRELIKSPFPSE